MTIEERLRGLILSRYPTVKDFAAEAGIKYTTLLAVLQRGVDNSGSSSLIKICSALGITLDGLCEGRIEYKDPKKKNETTFRERQNSFFLALLEGTVTLDGVKMSQDEALLVDDFLTAAADTIRRRRDREARS